MGGKDLVGNWNPLASKGRYFVFSLLGFGVPVSVALVAQVAEDLGDCVVLVMLCLGASQLFAALTWPYMRGANERLQRAAESKTKGS